MIAKLLVANRGEIACRIMRTCRRMGIGTVAVYSDADANARHVREADEAVRIGAPAARESYLNQEAIVAAAIARGAAAIHPGYGFLSEKLELIDACNKAGITFVGPHRDAIARMGSKIESKRIARAAGVPCIPGYDGDDQALERLMSESEAIGFPLLIKASAGGGGKGMKLVRAHDELGDQLVAAKAEASSAFGDEKVLLERFIERPRHLEVQLLGDRHGNLIHLFERECSIQRNYQKVIEEAPAAHLSPEVREHLFESALSLGRAIGYDSTGTVEFVLDADDGDAPYFLEMNTRLQVEHSVTEMITGLDLVEQQIRSSLGERLPFGQNEIEATGWAIEARINAEAPEEDFRSSFGPVARYHEPAGAGIRIDSGVDAGSMVSPYYDSMLVKLIAYGASRSIARERLQRAAQRLFIGGVDTNQGLIADILEHCAFNDVLTTRFLADAFPGGWLPPNALGQKLRSAAAAAWYSHRQPRGDAPLAGLTAFRLAAGLRPATYQLVVQCGSALPALRLEVSDFGVITVFDQNQENRFTLVADGTLVDHEGCCFLPTVNGDIVRVWCEGHEREWQISSLAQAKEMALSDIGGGDTLRAELPGVVTQMLVQAGDLVVKGQPLLVIEAMKLLHTIKSLRDGRVAKLGTAPGETVAKGALLVALEAGVPDGESNE